MINKEIVDVILDVVDDLIPDDLRYYEDEIKQKLREKGILQKSVEEQVFDLVKDELVIIENKHFIFNEFKNLLTAYIKDNDKEQLFYRQCLFLAIMKGVHKLIENGKKNNIVSIFYIENENEYYCANYNYNTKSNPYYFYFSTVAGTERAKKILSNFFGINILNWWYKNDK